MVMVWVTLGFFSMEVWYDMSCYGWLVMPQLNLRKVGRGAGGGGGEGCNERATLQVGGQGGGRGREGLCFYLGWWWW